MAISASRIRDENYEFKQRRILHEFSGQTLTLQPWKAALNPLQFSQAMRYGYKESTPPYYPSHVRIQSPLFTTSFLPIAPPSHQRAKHWNSSNKKTVRMRSTHAMETKT